jgi:hypothetical protein
MPTFKWISLAVSLFLSVPGTQARADSAGDLSGAYVMKGQGNLPADPPYRGRCELALNDRVYTATCVNDNGDRYVGKGILEGDVFSLYLGEYLVVYRVGPDRSLTGRWAHTRSQDTGQESLVPIQ